MGVIMKYNVLLFLGIAYGVGELFSNEHAAEINHLRAQAFNKLTAQLRTGVPADLNPEKAALHALAQKHADQQNYIEIGKLVAAAGVGAALVQAAHSSTPQRFITVPTPGILFPLHIDEALHTSRFMAGFEIPTGIAVAQQFLPSTSTLLYGGLAIAGALALYELNRAMHASCREKLRFSEYKWTQELLELQKTNGFIKKDLIDARKKLGEVLANQEQQRSVVRNLGGAIASIQTTLKTMARQAHWDVETARARALESAAHRTDDAVSTTGATSRERRRPVLGASGALAIASADSLRDVPLAPPVSCTSCMPWGLPTPATTQLR